MRQASPARQAAWPPSWRSGRAQGHHRCGRSSLRMRGRRDGGPRSRTGQPHRRRAARRGCHHHGQDGDDRACLHAARRDPQPARPGAHARRVLLGIGRRRGRRPCAARRRIADQRVGQPPGLLLRHLLDQADGRGDPALRRAGDLQHARPDGRLRQLAGGYRAAVRRHRRL